MSKEKGKGSGGAPDELEETKAKLLAKELELITERNNMRRIQERSHLVETHIDRLTTASKEKIRKLEDIITFLNGEGKVKDTKIGDLETDVAKMKEESKAALAKLNKEMEDAQDKFDFKYNSLQLQFEAATVKLRELHDFGIKKKVLEEELANCKIQLLKEHESKIELLGEAERNSLAVQDKLKKEIASIAMETEKQMKAQMEEQLHSNWMQVSDKEDISYMRTRFRCISTQKTKRTIIENEQLRKEVQFHTHQTMALLKENEKLIAENHDLGRTINLLKEIEEDLNQKNHVYQKTMRILVHKLRDKDKQLASSESKAMTDLQKHDEEDLQELLIRAEQLKGSTTHLPVSGHTKRHAQDDAIEFLYVCLEDIELDTFARVAADGSSQASPGDVPLDQLDPKQRYDLLKALLKRATAVRLMTQSLDSVTPKQSPRHKPYTPDILHPSQDGKIKLDVADILALPVGKIMADQNDSSASMLETHQS